MSFEDIAAVLGQAFGMELKVVQDTTVFEVASDDGSDVFKTHGVSSLCSFSALSAPLREIILLRRDPFTDERFKRGDARLDRRTAERLWRQNRRTRDSKRTLYKFSSVLFVFPFLPHCLAMKYPSTTAASPMAMLPIT